MLTSRVSYTFLLSLQMLELTFPVLSSRHNERCYQVGNRDVCFFQPQANFTRVAQQEAWEMCRSNNGTLPIIPDERIQRAFGEHMISLRLTDLDDMWLAGREVRSGWTWANGAPYPDWRNQYKQRPDIESPYEVQAVVDDNLKYRKDSPHSKRNYICQFFGTDCQSKDSIPLKNGCLLLNDGEVLDLYDSRNKCVERGGDLAIIDGQDDLNKFREVFMRIRKAERLWVGLRKQWWIWGESGGDEAKYSNWMFDIGFKPDRECMVVDLRNSYVWKQETCSSYKRFLCQTGPVNVERNSDSEFGLTFDVLLVVWISIPLIVVLLVVVVVVVIVIVKKRKSKARRPIIVAAPRETSYLDLDRSLQGQGNLKNNQYTALSPSPMNRPLPSTDHLVDPQQMELNFDNYVYDDIAEISVPPYLELRQ